MVFEKLFEKIYNKLDKYFSQDDKEVIQKLMDRLQSKNDMIKQLQNKIDKNNEEYDKQLQKYQKYIQELETKIEKLEQKKKSNGILIKEEIMNTIKKLDKDLPKVDIYRKSLPVHKKSGLAMLEVFLPDYVQTFYSMKNWIEENNLHLSNYINKYKNQKEAIDKCRKDIYNKFVHFKRYRTDKENFGVPEAWSPNIISWYLTDNGVRHMDCESSSLLLMGLYKIAGIPRGLQRVVAGSVPGGGHAAVKCYMFAENDWVQFETTVEQEPIYSKDKRGNRIHIKRENTWFEFDWENSWSYYSNNETKGKHYKK